MPSIVSYSIMETFYTNADKAPGDLRRSVLRS